MDTYALLFWAWTLLTIGFTLLFLEIVWDGSLKGPALRDQVFNTGVVLLTVGGVYLFGLGMGSVLSAWHRGAR